MIAVTASCFCLILALLGLTFSKSHSGGMPVPQIDNSDTSTSETSGVLSPAIDNAEDSSPNTVRRRRRLAAKTVTLRPSFATYISKNYPDNNYRSESTVEVDDDPDRKDIIIGFSGNSFLSQVKSVDLVLDCVNESNDGGTVYESDERITRYVTWNNRPDDYKTHLAEVARIGTVYDGRTKYVDVSDLINRGRLHSEITLVIQPESWNGANVQEVEYQTGRSVWRR